jgi:ATP synthase protein I
VPTEATAAVRRALLVTTLLALPGIALATALHGGRGALGAALGVGIVLASNALTLVVLVRTRTSAPHVLQVAVLGTTVGKLMALMVVVVLLGRARWMHGPSFGVAVLLATLIFVTLDAALVSRAKVPILDAPTPGAVRDATGTVPPR